MGRYLFQSARLGFRNWLKTDIEPMAAMNADPDVMEFFPGTKGYTETVAFIERMQQQLADKGYCYYAVDKLENGEFIGFIGISVQAFEASFTPCIDIGWRLCKQEWNKGYATEGAQRCIDYAFNELNINKLTAIAPKANVKSERIMKKIGMVRVQDFIHPLLQDDERLRDCVLYEIAR